MNISDIKKIGVLGAGVMAPQIAYLFLRHGFQVVFWDPYVSGDALDCINKKIKMDIHKKKYTAEEGESFLNNFQASDNIEIISEVNFVIEAIVENEDIKRDVFLRLDRIISNTTVVASNTSSLSINTLSRPLSNSSRFIGMHFFNPVDIMKLVEIIPGSNTSQETISLIEELTKMLEKISILVKDSPGFIVNRLIIPMINEAANLLENGIASAEDIDKAMKLGANLPLGLLELGDLIGLDVCLAIMESLSKDGNYKISNLLRKLVNDGYLGRKAQKGFFEY